LGHEVNFNSWK